MAALRFWAFIFVVVLPALRPALGAESLAPLQDVVQVAAGNRHTCALSQAGTVRCWGRNERGQLGLGDASLTPHAAPVTVPGLTGIRAIAAGHSHSCALTAAGGVKCWGWNVFGAIGVPADGSSQDVVRPVDVQGLANDVVAIDAGGLSTCAVTRAGAVKCWGYNANGQLGDGSTTDRFAPVDSIGLGSAIASISVGSQHVCALTTAGAAKCWGSNDNGQIGDNSLIDRTTAVDVQNLESGLIAISAGGAHSCALTRSGAAKCWGANGEGQAGDGTPIDRLTPVDVVGVGAGYTAIATGSFHSCALNPQSGLKCWGPNSSGALGAGYEVPGFTTATVLGIGAGASKLSAGGDHNCVVLAGGLRCWGQNLDGQLGIDSTTLRLVPTQVSGLLSGMATIGGGNQHSCALTASGGVKCWGQGGSLGDGSFTPRLTPVDVVGLQSGVLALTVGFGHNCAIVTGGGVKCWGPNDARLGNGGTPGGLTPVDVVGLGAPATVVAAGRQHGCAVLTGGAVKCWGDNEFGQVGDGSTAQRLSAVQVSGLSSGITAIEAGWYHNCALTSAGGVKCWGANNQGQLGDGSTVNRPTPVDVVGLDRGIVAVVAGLTHTCAITLAGGVKCWGADIYGNGEILGDGSERGRAVPGDVPSLTSGAAELALGGFHTCVRSTSGGMQCWGGNFLGPLGDNSERSRPTPVDVAGLTRGVLAIGAGHSNGHTCAVVSGGAAKCWGDNAFAMLGDGTTFGIPFAQTVVVNDGVRRVAPVAPASNAASSTARSDASGRYVVFQSRASNLVDGDSNGSFDIYRSDRETGSTIRVSVDNRNAQISGDSIEPSISADGQLVVFVAPDGAVGKLLGESAAAARVRTKASGYGVFLRNLLTGTTQRVGSGLASGTGTRPQLAPNGGRVVFTAAVTDPSQGIPGQNNVFGSPLIRIGDALSAGSSACLSCKSVSAMGIDTAENSNGDSRNAVVSADGRFVAFETRAKNALAAAPSSCASGSSEVLLRDLLTGASQRVSPPANAAAAACGIVGSANPSMDYSGIRVAFETDAALKPSDLNQRSDVYLWQQGSAGLTRLSEAPQGADGVGVSSAPSVSGDGSQVSFVSAAPNLDVSFGDNNDRVDVHAVPSDGTAGVVRLSRSSTGSEANGGSNRPALSFDGSRLAFDSSATNLGAGALGGQLGVFLRNNPAAKRTRSATWAVASESGWGLTVFDQGNVLVPAWFTYDLDGEPTWFLMAGAFEQADGSYRGDLLRLTGVPFDRISGSAMESSTAIGTGTLRFSGDDRLSFEYDALGTRQSKSMAAFAFGTRSFACAASASGSRAMSGNYSDVWTGAVANAGWGLTIFHVDNSLFAGWYTYDVDREAVFFVLSTTRQADGSFAGSVTRTRNGTPFPQIDGSAASPGGDSIGSTVLRFENGERGSFSTTVNGQTQTQSIVRLVVGNRPTQCLSESIEP